MKIFLLGVIVELILLVQCAKRFHLGRSKGGNLGEPAGSNEAKLPPAQWFVQKLDHSRPTDARTWQQRYFVNESFYDFNNPGPVFLMIGGEGPASPKWMVQGAWIDYAKQYNALCIQLEHRYYGESHPTKDISTKNLLYLSSHQALADLANFISAMNDKYKFNKEVKWIAFGGSYPGSLAAWLRLKYPHLVHGAISSSGPLLAKVNFMEYFQVVVNALREKTGDEDCVTKVKLAHQQIETFLKTDPTVIERDFRVCKPFSKASTNDMKNFYSSIADDFADLVQYNEDNRIGDKKRKTTTINSVCNMLTQHPEKPEYKKLAEFNTIVLEEANETCLDYDYKKMITELRNVSWSSDQAEGGRQWMYQTCTEFGFYQTSSGEVEVFGNQFPLEFFIQQCQDVFGTKFDADFVSAGADWTNEAYGGLDIAAGRVVYVQGSVDPWHALGMTTTRDNGAPAIYIQETEITERLREFVYVERTVSPWPPQRGLIPPYPNYAPMRPFRTALEYPSLLRQIPPFLEPPCSYNIPAPSSTITSRFSELSQDFMEHLRSTSTVTHQPEIQQIPPFSPITPPPPPESPEEMTITVPVSLPFSQPPYSETMYSSTQQYFERRPKRNIFFNRH